VSALRAVTKPIFVLLAVLLLAGLFVFRDYGLTWDEPLFYKYADALGYAYTPGNWFSGHFDLNQSYGPSGDDHKTRGPAYLLLARQPAYLLETIGVDPASAWHLVNFLTFLLGVYFVYRLCAIFAREWAAVAAAALFGLQPMLWGHAFINPKDVPFLVFLTGSVWLGFRMVDRLVERQSLPASSLALEILLPAAFLGIATSNRVLGPLAGLLTLAYLLSRKPARRLLLWFGAYAVLAAGVLLATWPYLWESPARFIQVFQFMSDNPTGLSVLFADQVYRAYDLPRRYLPFFLVFALTEVVWPLFLIGLLRAVRSLRSEARPSTMAVLILAWLVVPLTYAMILRPPLYDGMRHFLFILPPVFIFAAIGLDGLLALLGRPWLGAALSIALLIPGIQGALQLHPYEYAYYNSFIGGTGGAFRHYETDYWLTCYREAVLALDRSISGPATLFVHREPDVALPYASPNWKVVEQRGAASEIRSGDYLLVNTRTNEDRQDFRDAPVILSVGRAGAAFCVVKRIP
jgi:4-amino-4-deoxy-L-arabinose transferase-like glycosyltransferase